MRDVAAIVLVLVGAVCFGYLSLFAVAQLIFWYVAYRRRKEGK